MKRLFIAITSLIILASCKQSGNESNTETQLDFNSFNYITEVDFLKTRNDVFAFLPENAQLISDSEDGFYVNFENAGIMHNASFMFYGNEFLSDAFIDIHFNEFPDSIDRAFTYINKLLENKFGAPSSFDESEGFTLIEWTQEQMDHTEYFTLSKSDLTITYAITMMFGSNYEELEEDGEWVQVGEDGKWVFVPNN